jgi:hypothetical protein
MTINVYWSVFEEAWPRAEEPKSLLKHFYERRLQENDNAQMSFHKCPFLYGFLKNHFCLSSLYDYSFEIKNGKVFSNQYDQQFFDDHVIIRSIEKKSFSFTQKFAFFSDEKSLKMDIPVYPFLEENNISERCLLLPGSLDIGKYFRLADMPFFLKNNFNSFKIEEKEIFSYIKFNSNEKIKFLQFYPSSKLEEYANVMPLAIKNRKYSFESPEFYYKKFKIKSLILKEIKKNLL